MALDNGKLRQIYTTLQKGGYDNDYNTFVSVFSGNNNYPNRKYIYDLLTAHGEKVGSSYEEFMSFMQQPKQQPKQQQQARPAARQNPGHTAQSMPWGEGLGALSKEEGNKKVMEGAVDKWNFSRMVSQAKPKPQPKPQPQRSYVSQLTPTMNTIYDILKDAGEKVGSVQQFQSYFERGYGHRKAIYDKLVKLGAFDGSYNEFAEVVGLKPKNALTNKMSFKRNANNYQINKEVREEATLNAVKDNDYISAGNTMLDSTPIQADEIDSDELQNSVYNTINDVLLSEQRTDLRQKGVGFTNSNIDNGRAQLKQDGFDPVINSQIKYMGKVYDRLNNKYLPVYQTTDGKQYHEALAADKAQRYIDVTSMPYREIELRRRKQELEDAINKRGSEIDRATPTGYALGGVAAMGLGSAATPNNAGFSRLQDTDYLTLQANLKEVDEALGEIEEAKHGLASDKWIANSNGDFERFGKRLFGYFGGSYRGFMHSIGKVSTWDFGLSDIEAAMGVARAVRKADKVGFENLSKEQQKLLNDAAQHMMISQEYAHLIGRGYKAGQVTAESLPFMLEMIVNPASSMGKAAQQKVVRSLIKKFGKDAIRKSAQKYLLKKYGARVVGDALGASVMASTTGSGRVYADTRRRMTGDLNYNVNESGEAYYDGHEKGESFVKAFAKAFGAQAIENHSEMLGEYIKPLLGVVGKTAYKGLTKATAKNLYTRFGVNKVRGMINDVMSTPFAKFVSDLESRAKWNGMLGEYAEEVIGNVENALLVGDNTLDADENTGVFDLDQNIDTFLGVSLMGGFVSSVKTGYYLLRGKKRLTLNEMNKAGRAIDSAFSGNIQLMNTWGGWRNTILLGTDEEKKSVLREILDNKSIPMNVRMRILDYAKSAQEYQGIVKAQQIRRYSSDEASVLSERIDNSADEGYEATNEQKNAIRRAYRRAKKKFDSVFGEQAKELLALDENELFMLTDEMTTKKANAIYDYLDSKSRYEGMLYAVQDKVNDAVDDSNKSIDERTHTDGTLIKATMNVDDRQVYIVNGNIVLRDDGSIDMNNSDKSIVIVDAETNKREMVAPSAFKSVDTPVSAEEVKAKAAQEVTEQITREESDIIDGKLDFNVGDTYDVVDQNENQFSVQIIEDKGDNVVVQINGQQTEMAKADVQKMYDDYVQLQDEAEDNKDGNAEAQEESQTANELKEGSRVSINGVEYTIAEISDNNVTLVDSNGKRIPWSKSALDAKLKSGDAEVLKPMADVKVGDVYMDNDGDSFTITRIEDNNVYVADSKGVEYEEPYEISVITDMINAGMLTRKENENASEAEDNASSEAEDNASSEGVSPASDEEQNNESDTPISPTEDATPATSEPQNESMPMKTVGKGKNARQQEDWLSTTPKRGYDYLFNEVGLKREEAKGVLDAYLAEAQKKLDAERKKEVKFIANVQAYKEKKIAHEQRITELQAEVDYWKSVKDEYMKVLLEEKRERDAKDAADHDQAVEDELKRKEDEARKKAEAEARGSNAVSAEIRDKWNEANKIVGAEDEVTLPNGETITGHYILVESGAATPSHQSTNGFEETEGFPVDQDGKNVNDRDYKRDKEAQQITLRMGENYDQRAIQSPIVVSQDGVVLSGNGRTMAGEIAAQNGTDIKYNDYLRKYGNKYGFTQEQIAAYQHPRVVFVPDVAMPYNSETFAKFNQREQKSQNRTETAVKMGKLVSDDLFGRVMSKVNEFSTLGEFYANDKATTEVIKELAAAGVIPQTEMAGLFDGGKLSEVGQGIVEGVMIGKAFQANPDAVRQITEIKSMRQAVMTALQDVAINNRLGNGYDLSNELAAAIDLVYKARKAGFQLGQHVSQYAHQGNLFQLDDGATVADFNNAAVMMLADVLNDKRVTILKQVISSYNAQAENSSQGIGDLLSGGAIRSKEEIINEINQLYNNGQEYNRTAETASDRQGRGSQGSEQGTVDSESNSAGKTRELANEFNALATELNTAEGEERMRVLGEMRDCIAHFAEENGYPVPEFLLTREDFLAAVPEKDRAKVEQWLDDGWHCPAYYEKGKVYYFVEGCDNFDKDVSETLSHEYTHADNAEYPENVNALTYAVEDTHEVSQDELIDILETLSNSSHYEEKAERLESEGKNSNPMLADEVIAHAVSLMVVNGEQTLDGITKNPTLQFIIKRAYKVRENERRHNILASETSERSSNTSKSSEANSGNSQSVAEGESKLGRYGRSTRSESNSGRTEGSADRGQSGIADSKQSVEKGGVTEEGTPLSSKIEAASAKVNTEPTEAQKEAGNYKKGHVQVGTFDITIEQPQGSVRKGTDADGKQWESKMNNTYGYIRGAVGVDGDHIDVFLSNDIDGWNGRKVFVVDQYNPDGSFDEHKVMLGFNEADEAKSDYLANYEKGWEDGRRIDVSAVNLDDFEKWIASSKRKTKPFGEYKSVKSESADILDEKHEKTSLTDEEVMAITDAMKANAVIAPTVEINDANWKESVDTPIGTVKMGKNQKAKLFAKGREQQYGMLLETLSNPDVVLEERDKEQNMFHERPSSYLFVKTFQKEDGSKYVHFESVTVSQGGMEVSISSHIIRENQLKNKLKSDRLLYKATALDAPANTSAEQPIVGGSHSSDDKGKENVSSEQGNVGRKNVNGENESVRQQKADIVGAESMAASKPSKSEVALRDAVIDHLRENGMNVITDEAEGQSVLDMANGRGAVRAHAMISSLAKAANTIRGWITGNKRGKSFTIELPETTRRMIRKVMGRDFDSHNITANGVAHAQKNHGVGGQKLNENSIPLTKVDMELIPYIMTAPDYVRRGSDDVSGRVSVRFYKELSNGYVVVAEKEYKNSPDDMETITMWAEMSDKATNAQRKTVPDTHVQNAILDIDAAKIRKDAENAIAKDQNIREWHVYHGSGADTRFEAARHKSKEAEERDKQLRTQDLAIAIVTGKTEQQVRAERRERERRFKEETKELYERVLSGNFDDVTLRLIDNYINQVTPYNYYGRPLSKRLPPRVGQKVSRGEQTGSIDALFSRICESAVGANERTRSEARRRIEEKKKELLKGWAIATGNWHTSVKDFTDDTEPLGSGKDSDVYMSRDGRDVIKVSKGKDNLKRFRPDMDNVALFNYVFPNSSYDIVGYGEVDGNFVRFLRQPFVDFTDSTPLSVEERVAYMEHLGFKPINDEKTAFSNGQIVAADIQKNNIVKDKQGNIRVIDADMRLHTKDMGGDYAYPPVERDTELNTNIREHRVYHGSGAEFDAFDHNHMGEGEGAQAYGWGTYVTEVEGIGRTYAKRSMTGSGLKRAELESNISRAKEQLPFVRGEVKEELEAKIRDWETQLENLDESRHLYTVEIPEDNGTNYLHWEKPVSKEQQSRIIEQIRSEGITLEGVSDDFFKGSSKSEVWKSGESLYGLLDYCLLDLDSDEDSQKKASELLMRSGFSGISYPAEARSGGRKDGARNYVIFNEKDAQITDHVRFFRTANGEAYGFTVGGKIYIDPKVATSETPVHEYAHLWATALKTCNPKEWQNIVSLMKGTSVWNEVKKLYPELKSDDEIADEVLATYSGRRGAERLREEMKKAAAEKGNIYDKAAAVNTLQRVKQAIDKFWKAVADFLHIHYESAEQVADQVMKDLLNGVDPRKMNKAENGFRLSAKQKRALETATIADESTNNATVVSSAAGAKGTATIADDSTNKATGIPNAHAKVQTNLENLARVYAEKATNKTRGFITDLSRALNLTQHEASNYGTFALPNGKTLAIRISNHNARVSNFDKNNENNGISIVISSHRNKRLNNDGKAHIVEYFYHRRAIENATGKPLAEILESIKDAINSGEFKDTTGLAERQEVNGEDVMRYQLIGEQGAERADHAEEVSTRLDNLSVAREMEAEKKDAKAIKMATGWERGADGKWRYEIADMKEFDRNGNLLYRKHHPDYARYIELQDKDLNNLFEDGEELTDKEREEYEVLSKKYESDKFGGEKLDNNHTLEAYVDAPELFKAYPELKDVGFRFEDTGGNEIASYRYISSVFEVDKDDVGEIVVNTGKVSKNTRTREVKSAVLHEIQHAIQEIEGFARGGNPKSMQERFEAAKKEWRARAWADALRDKADEMGEHYNQAAVEKALIDEYKEMGMDNDEWMPNKEIRIKGFNYFARGYSDRSMDADIKNFRLAESTRADFSPYVEYSKLGGEVESRNVEHRMNMTPEERRASLAAETEDVSREDQIFLFGNNEGGSYSLKDGSAHLGRGKNVGEASDAEGYTAFANQYGVDAEVVKDYASGMKTGNLQKAEMALAEIRRTMRVANRGMKLSEFGKLFRPVQNELTERYGDIEKLRQEYIDAVMRERGVMEAARKRAEEEEAKRKARADELSLLSTEELDKRYFDAIENGDEVVAREMLDEAARRKGYDDTESDYQGVGAWSAPSNPSYESDADRRADVEDNAPNVNVEDIALGYSLVDEKYWHEPRKYMQSDATALESVNSIKGAISAIRRGEKDVKVKVYRAVPTSVKEGKYRIIEDEVPVSELWWDGNDSREWGFDDGRGYKYKNVENNRKLNDLVTRDDNGEIIPPSKRFDENVEDVRYREAEPKTLKGEEALAALENIFRENAASVMPETVSSLERFKDLFRRPIRTFLGELVKVKDEVWNKILRNNRQDITGTVLPTIENADFAIRDTDGSTLYVKRFESERSGNLYNIVVVNKHGEVEDYVSSVHIKRDGNLRNKIKNGAELFLPQERNTDGNLSRNNSTPAAKVVKDFGNSQLSPSEKSKHQVATDLARQMHIEGVVDVLESNEGLSGRKARAKGWFDPITGRITIVLSQNENAADVARTIFHEAAAHLGLRELVGKEHYDTFLDNIYNNAEKRIQDEIKKKADEKYKGDLRRATDEYMAELAEDGEFVKQEHKSFLQQIKDSLISMLRKVGIKLGFELNDNDLRYILWRSWKNLAEGNARNIYQMAEDARMQDRLLQTPESQKRHEQDILLREANESIKNIVEDTKKKLEQLNEDKNSKRIDAVQLIGGQLSKLHEAMRVQREYDMHTVASITELAQAMLKIGMLKDLSNNEANRILSVVKNVHGKRDISQYVQNVFDIMIDNQLKNSNAQLTQLLMFKGKKKDARGVEVQGKLDVEGQRIADVVWHGLGMSDEALNNLMSDLTERMNSSSDVIAKNAKIDYAACELLKQYNETIRDSKSEEKELRASLAAAKEDLDAGNMEHNAYLQYRDEVHASIRENKMERIEAYQAIVNRLGGMYGESMERAKQWREAEIERVKEIHHNANSDMEGRPCYQHYKPTAVSKAANSSLLYALTAPLGTFEEMLRMFGNKNVRGEGYLWNRYMRGFVDARNNEVEGYWGAMQELDDKVAEVFGKGKKWSDLFSIERKLPKGEVRIKDGNEVIVHELPQGNLLYIYMVNKMSDGRMKLRKMDITEAAIEDIESMVDPKLKMIADWLQDEFLVKRREKYNKVHERMFGASMAAIDNYFPLKILKNAIAQNTEIENKGNDNDRASTITGSIKKRTRNSLALDIMNADAFSVVIDHIKEMEHWAAFAEWNRDLNTLLSYKRFRNQVINMSSVYGAGNELLSHFEKVCQIAAGVYKPSDKKFDKVALNIAKGVTGAKVTGRVFTAFKQLTSYPAYLSDANPLYLANNLLNPAATYEAWKWSMENLPMLRERFQGRFAGDPLLMSNKDDWSMWRSKVAEFATKYGMAPNAFVDALTISMGTHAVYKTKLAKYLRMGYSEEQADKRAKQDATISYNMTQQSSEGAFMSMIQSDRTWITAVVTAFRNSSISYTRMTYNALRNTLRRFKPGYRGMSEEFMAKQMEREGIDPNKASEYAKREYRLSVIRDFVTVGVFAYILPFVWNLTAYTPYLLFGDDDDKKKDMWSDIFTHTMFGSVEGLALGDMYSATLNSLYRSMFHGEDFNANNFTKDLPFVSDINTMVKDFQTKEWGVGLTDVLNIMIQSGIGINPQTLTDAVVAIYDYCGADEKTPIECALLIMRIMNCPQSQMDKIYFDELDMTGAEAKQLKPSEIAKRYAEYKAMREAPIRILIPDDGSAKARNFSNAEKRAKEDVNAKLQTEETKQLLNEYKETAKKLDEIGKLKDEDEDAYIKQMQNIKKSDEYKRYKIVGKFKAKSNKFIKIMLNSENPEERKAAFKQLQEFRDSLIKSVNEIQ